MSTIKWRRMAKIHVRGVPDTETSDNSLLGTGLINKAFKMFIVPSRLC